MTTAAVMSRPPASRPPHAIDLSQERPAAPASVPVPMAPVSYAPRAWLQASPRETGLAASHCFPYCAGLHVHTGDRGPHHGGLSPVPRRERGARAGGDARPPETPTAARAVRVAGGP